MHPVPLSPLPPVDTVGCTGTGHMSPGHLACPPGPGPAKAQGSRPDSEATPAALLLPPAPQPLWGPCCSGPGSLGPWSPGQQVWCLNHIRVPAPGPQLVCRKCLHSVRNTHLERKSRKENEKDWHPGRLLASERAQRNGSSDKSGDKKEWKHGQ